MVSQGSLVQPRRGYYTLGTSKSGDGHDGDTVLVPIVSVTASAGPGASVYREEADEYVPYNEHQIRRETGTAPKNLAIIVASGDSMLPTISPGDRLLVAMHQDQPIVDGVIYIWRNRFSGVTVKRARWKGERLQLQGDNDNEPVAEISPSDDNPPWHPIARVSQINKHA